MDDNTPSTDSEKNRARAERILGEQIDGLEQMLSSVGVEFPAEYWEYLHDKVNISLASETIPALSLSSLVSSFTSLGDIIDFGQMKFNYLFRKAFYTHEPVLCFPERTIHLGWGGESASDEEVRYSISQELGHALSDFVIKEVRELPRSGAVAEFYEIALSWWAHPSDRDHHAFKFMRTNYLYQETMQPGTDIKEAAQAAMILINPDGKLTPYEHKEKMTALLADFETLHDIYPPEESGTHDIHIVGGGIGYCLLEQIARQTGKPLKECLPDLTKIAAMTLSDDVDFSTPETFLGAVEARLPEYLK